MQLLQASVVFISGHVFSQGPSAAIFPQEGTLQEDHCLLSVSALDLA